MLLAVYADVKDLIGHSLELSEGALHVHLGLVLFLIGTRLIRAEPRFLRALGWLLALCLVNEVLDWSYALNRGRAVDWFESTVDIANTMIWPGIWALAGHMASRVAIDAADAADAAVSGRRRWLGGDRDS